MATTALWHLTARSLPKNYNTAKNASNMIGQTSNGVTPIYTKNTTNDSPNADLLSYPNSVAIDTTGNRLFVSEYSNNRVLVFNLNADHSLPDYNADYVLGQSNFYSNAAATTQAGMSGPQGLYYDPVRKYLFVADSANHRVLVYDVTTISNGQNAAYYLGQSSWTAAAFPDPPTSSSLHGPTALAYDPARKYLFVADANNQRVMVFDFTTPGNNKTAVKELGQSDFTNQDLDMLIHRPLGAGRTCLRCRKKLFIRFRSELFSRNGL